MVNFADLHPGSLADMPPERLAVECMRLVLVRTNLVTGYRFALGWRGVSQAGQDGWTARIKDYPGVFGLGFHWPQMETIWRGGVFRLAYFPSPEEDLLEKVSLAAAAMAQREDYPTLIREFTIHPELIDLFGIGRVSLLVDPASGAASLGLQARTRDRIRSRDGVRVPVEGKLIELVAPGGVDRDFPSYDVAYAFFETLAASVTFNWQAPPTHLAEDERPGVERIFDPSGALHTRPAEDIRDASLWLGYGLVAGDPPDHWPPGKRRAGVAPHHVEPVSSSERHPEALWRVAHRTKDIQSIDKQALGIDDRPTLIVLTGFLGAGKTTFLRHFIEHQIQMSRFVAVIQNEIGAVGLDGKLMEEDVAVTEMDEGCVCCSLIGNLKAAVNRILSEFQPDVIVLETTGLANPFNLLGDLEELAHQVRFDSVTTVVDGALAAETLDRHAVARDQVRAADILLVNKTDLVAEKALGRLKQRLSSLNPRAAIISGCHGNIPPGLLYSADPLEGAGSVSDRTLPEVAPLRPTHHRDGIQSLKILLDAPLDRGRFIRLIEEKIPPTMLRIKGILEFSDAPAPAVFQYVGGRYDISSFNNSRVKERFLVFIGKDLDPGSIQAAINGSCLGIV